MFMLLFIVAGEVLRPRQRRMKEVEARSRRDDLIAQRGCE